MRGEERLVVVGGCGVVVGAIVVAGVGGSRKGNP